MFAENHRKPSEIVNETKTSKPLANGSALSVGAVKDAASFYILNDIYMGFCSFET